jgi:hypothetical protein
MAGLQYFAYLHLLIRLSKDSSLGSDELRFRLRNVLVDDEEKLRLFMMEGALNQDIGGRFVSFCHNCEGDGVLSFFAYEIWLDLEEQTRNCYENPSAATCPSVYETAALLEPEDDEARQRLIDETIAKMAAVVDKLLTDTHTRIAGTLAVLRACRLLDPRFIATNTLEVIEEELVHANHMPICVELMAGLRAEMRTYRTLAVAWHESNPPRPPGPIVEGETENGVAVPGLGELEWSFWPKNYTHLKSWYMFAADAALVSISSASVERVFALCEALFGDEQSRALADYRTTCIMLRYNQTWRERYSDV